MSKIVTWVSTFDPAPLVACLPEAERVAAQSLRDLANRIVDEQDVRVVIIQQRMTDEVHGFLRALKRSFPRLDVAFVAENDAEKVPPGVLRLDGRMDLRELCTIFRGICGIIRREPRDKARFDWPLQGQVSLDSEAWKAVGVRSISASGALLAYDGPLADPGTTAELRMDFQGSSLRTRCEILDARPATAALPRGFGARFVGLPLSAARAIDAIVRNVLLAVLLEPDAEPAIPTLSAAEPQSR